MAERLVLVSLSVLGVGCSASSCRSTTRRTRPYCRPASCNSPTATHSFAVGHDTAVRPGAVMLGAVAPPGFGALWIVHPPAPSRSTSTPPASPPTAVHAPRREHDTAARLLVVSVVARVGVCCADQVVPL